MASWSELSKDNLRAARELHSTDRVRSAISRAYYAAYAAVTAQLAEAGVQFPHDGNNPSHERLPALVLHNLQTLPTYRRRQLASALRRLRLGRVAADYVPTATINGAMVRDLIRDAATILQILEVNHGAAE